MFTLAGLLIVFGCWPMPIMDALGPAVADLLSLGEPAVMLASAPIP